MNAHTNKPQYLGQEAEEEKQEVNVEAPIGLPGENAVEIAPEITLTDDEGHEEKKRGPAHVFRDVMAKLRAARARKAAEQHEPIIVAEGVEVESLNSAGASAVEGLTEEGEAVEAASAIGGYARPKLKISRNALLGGGVLAAVWAVAAAVAFWPSSPQKPVVAEQGMIAEQSLLAPAATLASVPRPEIKSSPELPSRSSDPLKEILGLKPLEDPAAAKGGAAKASEEKVARVDDGAPKPAMAQALAEQPNAETAAGPRDRAPGGALEKAAAKPVVEEARPQSVVEVGMVPGKPVEQADAGRGKIAEAKEAPPSPQRRIDAMQADTALLDRVTQLAAQVVHLTDQVNRVERVQKEQSSGTQEGFADLKRRMALAESRHQLDEVAKAQDPRNLQVAAVGNPPGARVPAPVVLRTGPAVAPVESAGERRAYRVQAASPSLAMLGTGGNDAPLEITPGSTVPGWGRVSKIEQRGQTWVVVTTGGVIQ